MSNQEFIDDIADEGFAILSTSMSKKNKAKKIIPELNRLEEIGL